MCADFEKSAQIPHATGKGSIREDVVRRFLRDYLPSKYAVGEGQIIHSSNRISGQIDIVIYDQSNCPRLLVGEGHSIFPLESVYGIVSVKSVLTSSELSDAFDNVVSAKELTEERTIIISNRGMMLGLANPIPVGIIFAFDVNRALRQWRSKHKNYRLD